MKTLLLEDKERALQDIEILTETAREPFLVLDKNLQVIKANHAFYQIFGGAKEETEGKFVYDLGNRQWNLPELRKLLEEILPQRKIFNDYEVEHRFPSIGRRIMILNARQLDTVQLIILCFEDVTVKREAEKKAIEYTRKLEVEVAKRTKELAKRVADLEELTQVMVGRELKMSELKKEIVRIKKLKKLNGNGHNHTPGLIYDPVKKR